MVKTGTGGSEHQRRPIRINTSRITTIRPSPPVGAYPQLRLWGHAGKAPRSIRIKRIKRTVLNICCAPADCCCALFGIRCCENISQNTIAPPSDKAIVVPLQIFVLDWISRPRARPVGSKRLCATKTRSFPGAEALRAPEVNSGGLKSPAGSSRGFTASLRYENAIIPWRKGPASP